MDLRIGIADSPQIVELELEDGIDRDALKKQIDGAVAGKSKVLWLIDRKGKELAIPAEKIGFVEIGSSDAERRIGFA